MSLKEYCESKGFKYNLVQDSCYQYCFVIKDGISFLTTPWSFKTDVWDKQDYLHKLKKITVAEVEKANSFETQLKDLQEGYVA